MALAERARVMRDRRAEASIVVVVVVVVVIVVGYCLGRLEDPVVMW
jgi:hypothetical protein